MSIFEDVWGSFVFLALSWCLFRRCTKFGQCDLGFVQLIRAIAAMACGAVGVTRWGWAKLSMRLGIM